MSVIAYTQTSVWGIHPCHIDLCRSAGAQGFFFLERSLHCQECLLVWCGVPLGNCCRLIDREGLMHVTRGQPLPFCSAGWGSTAYELLLFFLSCERELHTVCVLLHCQQNSHWILFLSSHDLPWESTNIFALWPHTKSVTSACHE